MEVRLSWSVRASANSAPLCSICSLHDERTYRSLATLRSGRDRTRGQALAIKLFLCLEGDAEDGRVAARYIADTHGAVLQIRLRRSARASAFARSDFAGGDLEGRLGQNARLGDGGGNGVQDIAVRF